jgi:hypothetical protein
VFASIAAKLQAGETQPFVASYSASTPSGTQTVEYAAHPPTSFLFRSTEPGGARYELIGSADSTYSCQQSKGSTTWTCLDTGAAGSTEQVYTQTFTGAYWYKQMQNLEAAATVAGVTYETSTMSLAGQPLACISYSPRAGAGGEVCVTASGVLGYVHDNSDGTTFRLTSYASSANASLFEVPAGAVGSSGTG